MESHDKIKRAIELAGSADDQELFELLVGLREDIARLRDDNIQLKERSGELQRQLNEKQEVVVDRQSIWRKKPDGTLEGPYCPSCYGSKQNFVLMTKQVNPAYYGCAIYKAPIEVFPERGDDLPRERYAKSSLSPY